jgi:PiT family inorganic phosphate transporter
MTNSLFVAAAQIDPWTWFFLILAVGLALSFEFVNGFHDTANAVATVIYTNTLTPVPAVVWSGIWNLIGVLTASGAVAFGIIALLPVELVLNIGSVAGFAMVFSLLVSAIIWNVGTWWLGLPASSSHTLIGAILGVGLANSLMSPIHSITAGVNWSKAQEVGLSLLISPITGFLCAGALLLISKALIKNESLYRSPEGKTPPPTWIRGLLMLTCTGVSFAHGSNDGQKGMGLIMLILVGILPGIYALKMDASHAELQRVVVAADVLDDVFEEHAWGSRPNEEEAAKELAAYIKPGGQLSPSTYGALDAVCDDLIARLKHVKSFANVPAEERGDIRSDLFLLLKSLDKLDGQSVLAQPQLAKASQTVQKGSKRLTNYIPTWVKVSVAFALGLGTMIGWKRIVVTVGEKIGKTHLTYAQGAAAELTAMSTILVADHLGLPVSTTHVLSSGIAGTMAANHSGLQKETLRNILLAWVLTLPVCIFLGALLFAFAINAIALLELK